MLFNSYEFILLYLPLTLLGYFQLAKRYGASAAKNFLVLASLVFYSYWDISNLPLLLVSAAVNYCVARLLSVKRSGLVLAAGVAFDLAFLAYFKYTDFILTNINTLCGTALPLQNIVLPLGISFFTFTQTAYLVDVYRGETKGYSGSDYLLFVTLFPHLIAGPILYHKDMIPQFSKAENYRLDYKNLMYGITWFTVGLFKKVIIADKLAVFANEVFEAPAGLAMLDAWGGSLAYTLQLYFDFSGYSEMAIGLGLLFNFQLPINFNLPYRACSIIDFWRRWHMTLSAFLKNYLYIPLGGNRNGHHLRNIMITMLLGGLWHGAGWTFIFWGFLHGLYICINHLWRRTGVKLPTAVNWLLTFNAVNIAWIFFRAENFSKAMNIIKAMTDIGSFCLPYSKGTPLPFTNFFKLDLGNLFFVLGMILLSVIYFDLKNVEKRNFYLSVAMIFIAFFYSFLYLSRVTEFLYFQF